MARIRVAERGGVYRVTVHGPLEAADLRRLERGCGPALEHEVPPLTIFLDSPVDDAVTATYLEHLRARGARISGPEERAR